AERGVSAGQFNAPLPENAALRIELPADLRDEAGRTLANAGLFPLAAGTAASPPLAKFPAATFGIVELHAEPMLPVTVRHVERDLKVSGLAMGPVPVKDLQVADDAAIIEWLAKVKRYDEAQLLRS